jgi:uncharacterized protein (DUF362 family)
MKAHRVEIIPLDKVDAELDRALGALGPVRALRRGDRVAIKPNLTAPKPVPGVTTSFATIEAVVRALVDRGLRVTLVESDGGYNSFKGDIAFRGHNLHELSRRYGIAIANLSAEESELVTVNARGGTIDIPWPKRLLHDIDGFCSLPVPKIHCMTGISLAIKNQWGCVPDTLRLRFHPYFNDAMWQLNALLPNAFAVLDGRFGLTRQGPMEGDAVEVGCIAVASSLGACDVVGAALMCIDPHRVVHIQRGIESHFVPSLGEVEVVGPFSDFSVPGRFYLKRNFWNYVALSAWLSPAWNRIVYMSRASDVLHRIMYSIRKRPDSLS